jgi:SAM-dependent methyltransferase
MHTLLPNLINLVDNRFKATPTSPTLPIILDLGCGTGRNTISLLSVLRTANKADRFSVIGLDASRGMLEVARTAVREYTEKTAAMSDTSVSGVELGIFDLLQPDLRLPSSLCAARAAAVISTLVLEHIPLERFFAAAAGVMRMGGCLLVTNMHAEMGRRSQAGFTDACGVKVRPTSYCHGIADVLDAARGAGLEVVQMPGGGEDGVIVRGVDEGLGDVLGARAKKWVGVRVWFGVCFVKKI